jgi:hypothetical protein
MNPLVSAAFTLFGLIFLTLASTYIFTPAGALPPFLPGYEYGISSVRFELGIGTAILCLFFFALAWITQAPWEAGKEGR